MEFLQAFTDFIKKIIEIITNLVKNIRDINDGDKNEEADV